MFLYVQNIINVFFVFGYVSLLQKPRNKENSLTNFSHVIPYREGYRLIKHGCTGYQTNFFLSLFKRVERVETSIRSVTLGHEFLTKFVPFLHSRRTSDTF